MPLDLEIALAAERLDGGVAEERAAFGLFTIRSAEASRAARLGLSRGRIVRLELVAAALGAAFKCC